jgi:hypothetical protein
MPEVACHHCKVADERDGSNAQICIPNRQPALFEVSPYFAISTRCCRVKG